MAKPQKKRPLLVSRLARLIFFSNLIGLVILIIGATTMNRFEEGLTDFKIKNMTTQADLLTAIMGETATGYGSAAELDQERARDILRRTELPEGWRVLLHDRSGSLIMDSDLADDTITMETLDPIPTEAPPPPTNYERARDWAIRTYADVTEGLPWREAERERLRYDLKGDIRAALEGETRAGHAYTEEDELIVAISQPVRRVQNVLGVLTLESDDLDDIVKSEREALLPIIGVAFLAALLSSLALTLSIALPLRKLARAAEVVAKSSDKRDSIPDLSRRRDDIGDLSLRMRAMSTGLYDRIDDVANFAADVAHEIKNPLTSLRSASDTLRVAKTEEQRDKLIDIIQQDVGRMNRLITDISAASKVDADLARETAQTIDVAKLIGNLIDFYESTTEPTVPRVRYFGPPEGELFIRAFETPFAQVLRNLIDNALTFSPQGGEVRVTAEGTDKRVVLTVDDDGPGIPEDALETVFSRFYTDREKANTAFGNNSGLGLTICRQIVQAHKGTIHAENRHGMPGGEGKVLGARFVVDVPRVTKGGAPQRPRRGRREG